MFARFYPFSYIITRTPYAERLKCVRDILSPQTAGVRWPFYNLREIAVALGEPAYLSIFHDLRKLLSAHIKNI